MPQIDMQKLIEKYDDIIKEEVNVKNINLLDASITIKKIYKPIGGKVSPKFGKDTGQIIGQAKAGNVEELADGKIKVIGTNNTWELDAGDYEISYEGIDENTMAVDGEIIARLDLTITPELEMEGVAREISRFLNQMRKDADYDKDCRVSMYYTTDSDYMKNIISQFNDFLLTEAVLKSIEEKTSFDGDIISNFEAEQGKVKFGLLA